MSEDTTETQQGTEPEPQKRSGLSFTRLIGLVVILAVLVGGGYYLMTNPGVFGQGGAAVALVNGQEITRAQYDERYAQLEASVTLQGQSATTSEMQNTIKTQTLNDLISEELLLQAADKAGVTANQDAVNTQFDQSKLQFADVSGTPDEAAFQKALTDQGYTVDTFKATLTRNNIIQQYLATQIDLASATATDEEIQALYDQVAASNSNVPPLADVRDQVANQIVQQKQQQLITNYVAQLRASSTVETLLQ